MRTGNQLTYEPQETGERKWFESSFVKFKGCGPIGYCFKNYASDGHLICNGDNDWGYVSLLHMEPRR